MKNDLQIKNLIGLASDTVTTVQVNFANMSAEELANAKMRDITTVYCFKSTRKLAETLAEGDLVLAEPQYDGGQPRVVRVVKVDEQPEMDKLDSIEYKWLFQKVDTSALDHLLTTEKQILDKIKMRQRRDLKTQMLNALDIDNDELNSIEWVPSTK